MPVIPRTLIAVLLASAGTVMALAVGFYYGGGLNFPRAVRNALERAAKRHPDAFDDAINKDICPDCGTVFFVVKSEIHFCPHCGFRWAFAS